MYFKYNPDMHDLKSLEDRFEECGEDGLPMPKSKKSKKSSKDEEK